MSTVSSVDKDDSKSIKAYNYILKKILSGEYQPGQALSERSLSASLSISRTPVKDALKKLSFEGYVDMSPDKGAFVSNISLPDVLELYEIREAVEGLSARLCALRRTDDDLAKMAECIKKHKSFLDGNPMKINKYEDTFHTTIAAASRNKRLAAQIETTIKQCRRASIYQNLHNPQRVERSIGQHEEILAAIREGNSVKAEKAMQAHLEDVIQSTKALVIDYYYKIL